MYYTELPKQHNLWEKRSLLKKKKVILKRGKNGWPQLLKCLLKQNDESGIEVLGKNKKLHGTATSYVRLLGIL